MVERRNVSEASQPISDLEDNPRWGPKETVRAALIGALLLLLVGVIYMAGFSGSKTDDSTEANHDKKSTENDFDLKFPGTTKPPPTTSTIPTTTTELGLDGDVSPAVDALPEGVTCEAMKQDAFSYAKVLQYYQKWQLHDSMDPDGNGMPCEGVYSADEVASASDGSSPPSDPAPGPDDLTTSELPPAVQYVDPATGQTYYYQPVPGEIVPESLSPDDPRLSTNPPNGFG